MNKQFVSCVVHHQIATVVINHPPINSLNSSVTHELRETFEELGRRNEIRAVILTGHGKAFIAGADIKVFLEFDRMQAEQYALSVTDMQEKIEEFDWPVIAAINGYALGGGCELAMACDIRIASETAVFSQPELTLGVIPGAGGTQRLPRLIPLGTAKKMVFTGDRIDAREAARIGLVDEVAAPGDALDAAKRLAARILKTSPEALRLAKKAMNRGMRMPLKEALRMEAFLFGELFETGDVKERVDAFFNSRKPDPETR